nr:MAG TPA: hypothetical protein [Caudoviricetes sp.]
MFQSRSSVIRVLVGSCDRFDKKFIGDVKGDFRKGISAHLASIIHFNDIRGVTPPGINGGQHGGCNPDAFRKHRMVLFSQFVVQDVANCVICFVVHHAPRIMNLDMMKSNTVFVT